MRTKRVSGGFIYVCMSVISQRSFQEICKGVHMQKNQEQQLKKSPSSTYQYPPPSVYLICRQCTLMSSKSVYFFVCNRNVSENCGSTIWYQQVLQLWFELRNKNASNHFEIAYCMLKSFFIYCKRIFFSVDLKISEKPNICCHMHVNDFNII